MKPSHRHLLTALVLAVILISVLAAPTVARSTLAQAQARATGAATLADDTNATTNTTTNITTTTTTPAVGTGNESAAEPTPTPTAAATGHRFQPFNGTPAAIPGMIEAENYDTGGQGFAWFDRTPGNQGGAYRQDDVDIEAGGSDHVVAFVKSSEWLTYTVDIKEAGTYMATFRASSPWADREVWVWVDGLLKAQVRVPDTASFDTYGNATANLTLPAGSHYIRLEFVRDAQNLDFFSLERVSGTGGQNVTPTPTPTGTITPTPTPAGGEGNVTTPTGNVTPTPTATGNVTPTPTPAGGEGNVTVPTNATFTQAEVDLQLHWRKLWEDHVFWTRMVIINIADTPGGTNESVTRLLQNYKDMEDALRPYYGDAEAEKFGDLVQNHLLIAADLVTAVKANNSTGAAELETKWFDNADQIAADLASLNPNWDNQTQQSMWHSHLNTTLAEAGARLSQNWTGDIAAYDEVHTQALMMADMFSTGILKQFPENFTGTKTVTQAELDLQNGMRKLWTEHAEYTRLYLISALDDAPGTDAVAARLLQNQVDLGDAIKPVYGDAAGANLTALLRQHILIAVDIVNAVKANNTTAQAAAEANWTANADEIAAFLAGANPHWTEQELKDLLYRHLSTTKDELVARYTKDYAADVAAWDRVYDHILMMSDALSEGVIAQFPATFGK